jgi:pilus assembly protein CpaB
VGAVALAALALLTAKSSGPAERAGAGPSSAAVVAAQPVARGTSLQAAQLELASIPTAYLPPGALTDIARAAGRVVLADLAPGEVVTETRLARVRAGPVASLVPRGLRAFAVPTSLPPGAVAAGDRVDVLATYADPARTDLVIAAVEVLAVLGPGASGRGGLDLDAAASGAGSANTLLLLVTTEQEQRLAFARAFGNLEVTIVAAE